MIHLKRVWMKDMSEYYTTGKFAKMANVSQRTLRYYDSVGLLKPSFIKENGYRQYDKKDLLRLQKIILLRNLGFSIEEIAPMLSKDNSKEDLLNSLQMQYDLIQNRIDYYQNIKESLSFMMNTIESEGMNWNKVIEVLNLLSKDDEMIESYKNSNNLKVRIQLHDLYSQRKDSWFEWVFKQIDFKQVNTLLEIGCGSGELWKKNHIELRNRQFFLSDSSRGMIEDVSKQLSDDFSFMVFPCENIPFKRDFFDCVIANHVLFYLPDLRKGLQEIVRVLKEKGTFYCTTYGKNHMKEISELVHEFDSDIYLSKSSLYTKFGKENGKQLLSPYFSDVELICYDDKLVIDDAKPLVDYVLSCHGNQNEKLMNRYDEFYVFLNDKIKKDGAITITKEACLFKCKR
ncbi:MerR family transcriptional regulator [Floccifex sp.]|uniref:MerR family transcriptional regulator n=1 Tax=Floccifex sp. TaxID=2815810 RepID=UPI003F11E08B